MLKDTLQKPKPAERAKCIKCGKNDATKDDQMCDNCRFIFTLDGIINSRK